MDLEKVKHAIISNLSENIRLMSLSTNEKNTLISMVIYGPELTDTDEKVLLIKLTKLVKNRFNFKGLKFFIDAREK